MYLQTRYQLTHLLCVLCRNADTGENTEQPLSQIIRHHKDRVLFGDKEEVSLICVRRNHLWADSVVQFLKKSFDPRKSIRIIFHGEEAVDGGGPRKEYFRLLCRSIREESGAFFSNQNVVNFRPNVSLFHDRRFHLIGVMLATSILHGGPAFPFFPKVVYDYIAREQMAITSTPADVANPETLHILSMVHRFACVYIYYYLCV